MFERTAPNDPIYIFEMGFGTGLNALLTLHQAIKHKRVIHYSAIELFPLLPDEITQLNYGQLLSMQDDFLRLHQCDWEKEDRLNEYFTLKKTNGSVLTDNIPGNIHCIYFDAFSPTVQPELWTQTVFEKLYHVLIRGGTLVTYSSKSEVRRNMTAAGFSVKKIPGPYGKREMVVATK